jgi:prolipoprotein diacylglyceryl transferase
VIGVVAGARLGDVIFYQEFTYYINDPMAILQIWKGGLSSHGGAIGVLVAIWVFARKKQSQDVGLSFLRTADMAAIPTALLGTFIRIGNFINQEILGTQTNVPWAVVFGHPADGSIPVPRHPVQLYEALIYFSYLFTFHP